MSATTSAPPAAAGGPSLASWLSRLAAGLDVFSDAAVRIAKVVAVGGAILAAVSLAANVFTRYVLGYSIFGSEELARFAFLWVIWMGVSLAVKRSAVTVLTFLRDRGPTWWRDSVATFSGVGLGVLLAYCCFRASQYAASPRSVHSSSPALGVPFFYGIASMAVGYYFITLHYLQGAVAGAARLAGTGRVGLRRTVVALLGAAVIGALVWGVAYALLEAGAAKLVALAVIFVAFTLAGTPIVFMLSIVGILSTMSFLGLTFYPEIGVDPLFPFRTTQSAMGLSAGGELLVILMFLVVAEVLNQSGMSERLIRFAASLVGHLRGGMAYVCQLTSAMVSGISGSAQADAAIMTPLLVPAMEKEGYPRDVAAAVVAGASIKGPIGPISIMFIVYGSIVSGVAAAPIDKLLLSGLFAELVLLLFQGATVYLVVRRLGFLQKREFGGMRAVARTGLSAVPALLIPITILGGILGGVFTPTESAAVAVVVAVCLAMFWYGEVSPLQMPRALTLAAMETGIVMLLLGDSAILARVLQRDAFGASVREFLTDISDNRYVFLLVVNLLLLAVGIFVEPLPAVYVLAPFLAPVAVEVYGVDPVHFGLIMVFNLVLALIHPPIGLVLFLVSSIAKVSVERLSIVILPWLAVSLIVLFLVTYLPSELVLALSNLLE